MLQELAATRTQFMSVGSFSQARGRNVCYMLLEQRCAADLAMLIWILSKSIWVIFYTCFQSGAFNYCIVRWNGALSHKLPGFREKFAAVVATPVESTVCCFRLYKMFTVNAPGTIYFTWKIVSAFLDPVTVEKIKISKSNT